VINLSKAEKRGGGIGAKKSALAREDLLVGRFTSWVLGTVQAFHGILFLRLLLFRKRH
jgi:hypothetical protein